MSIDHDQGMPRLRSANRHADIPHRIDRARHADLTEDDVLDRLRLLLRNIVCRNDCRRLRLILCVFFGSINLDIDVFRLNIERLRTLICMYRVERYCKMQCNCECKRSFGASVYHFFHAASSLKSIPENDIKYRP